MLEALFVNKKKGITNSELNKTPWSEAVRNEAFAPLYPRPQMVRNGFISLDGFWDYAFTQTAEMPTEYQGKIRVPFSPEAPLSKVMRQLSPKEYLWYNKNLSLEKPDDGYHYLLHFGAVDQECKVYINSKLLCTHVGGYLPFEIDLPNELIQDEFDIKVCVTDESENSFHARGKQKLKRGGMFYTAQSGIWQSVWIEKVPDIYIKSVKISPHFDESSVSARIILNQPLAEVSEIKCIVRNDTEDDLKSRDSGQRMAGENYTALAEEYGDNPTLVLKDFISWSPANPYLYILDVQYGNDNVCCYFGMRSVTVEPGEKGHPCCYLNHKPCPQSGLLDQGYWPDGLYTPPTDEALIYDIKTAKELGFNMLRKHIKVESQRFYYHCDRLGMLVWQDMVCGGSKLKQWFVTYMATVLNIYHVRIKDGFGFRHLLSRAHKAGREEFEREIKETINLLYNHPSIIVWVPFNEGWGQFDALRITDDIKSYDPSRLVDHASGWFDQKGGDVVSLHYYFFKLHFLPEKKRFLALSEYGGYTLKIPGHSFSKNLYGYGAYNNSEELSKAYQELMENTIIPARKEGIFAFVYTQLSDIEDEVNGVMTYDREIIKINPDTLRQCNLQITQNYQGELL